MRLDSLIFKNGLAGSRVLAHKLIEAGCVSVDGKLITKPSFDAAPDSRIEISESEELRYVGRGGLKLEGALKQFEVDVSGLRAIDIGASTGGFTDCLLKHGCGSVVAVDSGHGQLHSSLVTDERVTNIEGFNARQLSASDFGVFDLVVMDVSFISQTMLHKNVASVLKKEGFFISLIKPQFEVGRSAVGKGGIVKKASERLRAIDSVIASAAAVGLTLKDIARSQITGGDGNTEYIALFKYSDERLEAVELSEFIKERINRS